jgi:hypothetical protein
VYHIRDTCERSRLHDSVELLTVVVILGNPAKLLMGVWRSWAITLGFLPALRYHLAESMTGSSSMDASGAHPHLPQTARLGCSSSAP